MSTVEFITPEQAQRALALCYKAQVPLNLVGAPGVGKTSAVESFVERMKTKVPEFGFWPIILAMKDTSDFGMPVLQKQGKKLEYRFPIDLPIGDGDAKGVLLFDELDRCPDAAVQNAAMQATLGHHFHGEKLPEGVYVVSAMNGTSDIYTVPLSEAARTRMVHVYVGTKADGYWDSWQTWALDSGIDPMVAGFVRFRADLFSEQEDQFEELARFNPRTAGWLMNQILNAVDEVKFKTDDILLPVLAGAVTRAVAVQAIAYRKIWKDLPDIEEIIRKPNDAALPSSTGLMYAVGGALARRVKDKDKDAGQAAKYVIRWPDEQAMYALTILAQVAPTVCATPEYSKFMNKIG